MGVEVDQVVAGLEGSGGHVAWRWAFRLVDGSQMRVFSRIRVTKHASMHTRTNTSYIYIQAHMIAQAHIVWSVQGDLSILIRLLA